MRRLPDITSLVWLARPGYPTTGEGKMRVKSHETRSPERRSEIDSGGPDLPTTPPQGVVHVEHHALAAIP